MAMTWEDQKMNVLTAGVVLVVGGMVAWHLFGGGGSTAQHPAAKPAAFANTAASVPASSPAAMPVAAAAYPGTPASIAPGGTSNPVPVGSSHPTTVSAQAVKEELKPIVENIDTLQQEVQELSTALGKAREQQAVEARRTKVQLEALAAAANPYGGKLFPTQREVAGYRLQSLGQTQAWLTNPDGETVIARPGERLPGLRVLAIAPQGVRTSRGWLGF